MIHKLHILTLFRLMKIFQLSFLINCISVRKEEANLICCDEKVFLARISEFLIIHFGQKVQCYVSVALRRDHYYNSINKKKN